MIAILTDKPNVGKEIARILGAHTREDGYMSGNGYMVTWTFGNMLSLAMPKDYGMDRPERGDFPINPAPFRLMVKHIRTDTGWIPDINAVLQLKVIEKVFDACESIIAATDASREGEMVFRYLYRYLECRKPYRRLWISSLTDEAVLEGMGSLRPGSLYDRMFLAADSRNKADWVLGLNASYALCQATGTGNNSLGRVQTPVLAAISSRYRERENHIATDTFPVFISLCKNNTLLKMRCTEEFTDREAAARLYSDCKLAGHARVTAVSRQIREIEPPALYNLTELQKDANNYYGMTAGKSLEIAQRLYEKKLISYPRTAGRFLPRDVYDKLPRIMEKILNRKEFRPYVRSMGINIFDLPDKVVDEGQAAEHHAIIITDTYPEGLNREEMQLYMMIIGRMLEAFSEKCVKDVTSVTLECAGSIFTVKGSVIKSAGWRAVFGEKEDGEDNATLPALQDGDSLPLSNIELLEKQTKPKPLHTESSLLSSMETAGKELENADLKASMKDTGIGTPATRAAIIETLFSRQYIVREKKNLVPTEKGLAVYNIIRDKKIADVEMTGMWENTLAKIESGEMNPDTFRKGIEVYARQITAELLDVQLSFASGSGCICPKCKTGRILFYPKVAKCSNVDCSVTIFRNKSDKQLTDKQITELVTTGKTGLIKGFKSKNGKVFDASLAFDEQFNVTFVFPEKKGKPKK